MLLYLIFVTLSYIYSYGMTGAFLFYGNTVPLIIFTSILLTSVVYRIETQTNLFFATINILLAVILFISGHRSFSDFLFNQAYYFMIISLVTLFIEQKFQSKTETVSGKKLAIKIYTSLVYEKKQIAEFSRTVWAMKKYGWNAKLLLRSIYELLPLKLRKHISIYGIMIGNIIFYLSSSVLIYSIINTVTGQVSLFKSVFNDRYISFFFNDVSSYVLILLAFSTILIGLVKKGRFSRVSRAFCIIVILLFTLLISVSATKRTSYRLNAQAYLYSISPDTTAEAWTDVVVTGKNFRNKPFVGKIIIEGIEQGVYVVEWTDERVIFRTSPEITKSGMLQLVPMERGASNKVPFVYNYHN